MCNNTESQHTLVQGLNDEGNMKLGGTDTFPHVIYFGSSSALGTQKCFINGRQFKECEMGSGAGRFTLRVDRYVFSK